nr:hypothetical protein [Geobacillus sp. TFV-3]
MTSTETSKGMPAAAIPFLHAMAGRDGGTAAALLILFSFFVVLALGFCQRFIIFSEETPHFNDRRE